MLLRQTNPSGTCPPFWCGEYSVQGGIDSENLVVDLVIIERICVCCGRYGPAVIRWAVCLPRWGSSAGIRCRRRRRTRSATGRCSATGGTVVSCCCRGFVMEMATALERACADQRPVFAERYGCFPLVAGNSLFFFCFELIRLFGAGTRLLFAGGGA